MKKFFYYLLAAATLAVAFTSCKDEDIKEDPVISGKTYIRLNNTQTEFTLDLKTNITLDLKNIEIIYPGEGNDTKDWIALKPETRGLKNEAIIFDVLNEWKKDDPRLATIKIRDTKNQFEHVVDVEQYPASADNIMIDFEKGVDASKEADGSYTVKVSEFGALLAVYVKTNTNFTSTIDESTPWARITSGELTGRTYIKIDAARTGDLYDYSKNRVAVVRITSADKKLTQKIVIKQDPRTAGFWNVTESDENPSQYQGEGMLESEINTEAPAMLATLENVKVVGPLNNDDLMVIQAKVPNMKTLDLSEAIFDTIPVACFSANTSTDQLEKVILPDGLKVIEADAFKNHKKITELNIPDGVIFIGKQALFFLESWQHIVIPRSVAVIEEGAIQSNRAKSIVFKEADKETITEKVTINEQEYERMVIGNKAFYGSSSVAMEADLVIPDYVTTIGDEAFKYLYPASTSTYSITIGKNVISMGKAAFALNYKIHNVTIKDGVAMTSGDGCFETYKSIKGTDGVLTIKRIKDIPAKFFYKPSPLDATVGITSIVLAEGVETIGKEAFAGTLATNGFLTLESITFPKSLKSIGALAFANNPKLAGKTLVLPKTMTADDVATDAFKGISPAPTLSFTLE